MKKTIAILIFSLLSAVLSAASYEISNKRPIELKVTDSKPVVLDVNFNVKTVKLILSDDTMAAIEALERGVVFIPKKSGANGTIIISAIDGKNYVVNISSGGTESVFHLNDPVQEFDRKSKRGVSFETERIATDIKNIVKAILLQQPMSGFKKVLATYSKKSGDVRLQREYRYIGGMYVADYWEIKNLANEALYFDADEFYTDGVLAVAMEKNRIEPGESIYIISILNKHAVYESNKSELL